uniref:Uncharacterized protein n=1 Tax=Candidatus Berkiella cookevillensis TaxID=437022 RepID=A0A0Q9YRF2_9GAMM
MSGVLSSPSQKIMCCDYITPIIQIWKSVIVFTKHHKNMDTTYLNEGTIYQSKFEHNKKITININ